MYIRNDGTIPAQARCQKTQGKLSCRRAGYIGAALAAIALLGCVLLILAHHGVPMGHLNALTNNALEKWVYLGMGLSVAALLVNLALARKQNTGKFIESPALTEILPYFPQQQRAFSKSKYFSYPTMPNMSPPSDEELGSQ